MIEILLDKSRMNYEIAQIAEEKGYYDVAMSRYYYALFQKINYLLRKKYAKFEEPQQYNDPHSYVVEQLNIYVHKKCKYLTNANITEILVIGDLKRKRVQADYKTRLAKKDEFDCDFKGKFNPCYKVIDSLI